MDFTKTMIPLALMGSESIDHSADGYFFIGNEHITKDVQGQRPSNINLNFFVCILDLYQDS